MELFWLLIAFVSIGILIEYACSTYFQHKLDHFKKISSEMNPNKQGEDDAKTE